MDEAGGVQPLDRRPHPFEQLVRDLLGGERWQRSAHLLAGDQHGVLVLAGGPGGDDLGHGDAGLPGSQQEVGPVLQLAEAGEEHRRA